MCARLKSVAATVVVARVSTACKKWGCCCCCFGLLYRPTHLCTVHERTCVSVISIKFSYCYIALAPSSHPSPPILVCSPQAGTYRFRHVVNIAAGALGLMNLLNTERGRQQRDTRSLKKKKKGALLADSFEIYRDALRHAVDW